eukprot:scaffold5013_cov51-Attheya_sp.AAC.3
MLRAPHGFEIVRSPSSVSAHSSITASASDFAPRDDEMRLCEEDENTDDPYTRSKSPMLAIPHLLCPNSGDENSDSDEDACFELYQGSVVRRRELSLGPSEDVDPDSLVSMTDSSYGLPQNFAPSRKGRRRRRYGGSNGGSPGLAAITRLNTISQMSPQRPPDPPPVMMIVDLNDEEDQQIDFNFIAPRRPVIVARPLPVRVAPRHFPKEATPLRQTYHTRTGSSSSMSKSSNSIASSFADVLRSNTVGIDPSNIQTGLSSRDLNRSHYPRRAKSKTKSTGNKESSTDRRVVTEKENPQLQKNGSRPPPAIRSKSHRRGRELEKQDYSRSTGTAMKHHRSVSYSQSTIKRQRERQELDRKSIRPHKISAHHRRITSLPVVNTSDASLSSISEPRRRPRTPPMHRRGLDPAFEPVMATKRSFKSISHVRSQSSTLSPLTARFLQSTDNLPPARRHKRSTTIPNATPLLDYQSAATQYYGFVDKELFQPIQLQRRLKDPPIYMHPTDDSNPYLVSSDSNSSWSRKTWKHATHNKQSKSNLVSRNSLSVSDSTGDYSLAQNNAPRDTKAPSTPSSSIHNVDSPSPIYHHMMVSSSEDEKNCFDTRDVPQNTEPEPTFSPDSISEGINTLCLTDIVDTEVTKLSPHSGKDDGKTPVTLPISEEDHDHTVSDSNVNEKVEIGDAENYTPNLDEVNSVFSGALDDMKPPNEEISCTDDNTHELKGSSDHDCEPNVDSLDSSKTCDDELSQELISVKPSETTVCDKTDAEPKAAAFKRNNPMTVSLGCRCTIQ